MLTTPPDTPRIPGYELRAPTEADALAALQRVFGPERGADQWARACTQAGLHTGAIHTADELERASQALFANGGPGAAIARSIQIRMRTYTRLAALAAATAGGPR